MGKRPQKDEGRDGDERLVKDGSDMYRYFRAGGSWYRIKAERV